MTNEFVLRVTDLKKSYGSAQAVAGISFGVRKGEIFGLLGPNGAGKTTTLECIEGIRRPSCGSILVAGCDPQTGGRNLRHALGVQLQSAALPGTLRVDEAMSLICSYQGVAYRADLIGTFGLDSIIKKQYHTLSTGQKRRLNLALSLISSPQVVVLDEPTAGLDVEGRASLHATIKNLRDSGITVLLATHDMAEAEELCDHIAILIKGRIATQGTPTQITAAAGTRTNIMIRTANGCLIEKGKSDKENDGYTHYSTDDTADFLMEILKKVKVCGDTVYDLRVERPSLEDCFLEIVKGGKPA